MIRPLSQHGRQFLTDAEGFRTSHQVPVLVWEAGAASRTDPKLVLDTRAGFVGSRPRSGDPLVFEVFKSTKKANAFAMGITLGRTETNDLPVDDDSVSRFHAWLESDGREWRLVDAESRNGTWLGALKLSPRKPEALPDGGRIRLGNVELVFMLPRTFCVYLERMMNGGRSAP